MSLILERINQVPLYVSGQSHTVTDTVTYTWTKNTALTLFDFAENDGDTCILLEMLTMQADSFDGSAGYI